MSLYFYPNLWWEDLHCKEFKTGINSLPPDILGGIFRWWFTFTSSSISIKSPIIHRQMATHQLPKCKLQVEGLFPSMTHSTGPPHCFNFLPELSLLYTVLCIRRTNVLTPHQLMLLNSTPMYTLTPHPSDVHSNPSPLWCSL